jgi:epoxyqueuosine reductase
MPADETKDQIRRRAKDLGFDAVGFASAEGDPEDARHLRQYLDEGRHGDMAWMADTAERRAAPRALWAEARSVICLGVNYGPEGDPRAQQVERGLGAISVYAQGRDYHDVLKHRLKALGRWLVATFPCEVKVFVDTAPVMEKPLAMRAGLGWIGKHTNLVSRRFGSWLFLGEVFTTLDLPPDPPEVDHCGRCQACQVACPTGALDEPYRIEPRRCISYLTIEHKGTLPDDLGPAFGNRIYGCDDCLAACPWNRFASATAHAGLRPLPATTGLTLAEAASLTEAEFRTRFAKTAVKRLGWARLQRNVAHIVANETK